MSETDIDEIGLTPVEAPVALPPGERRRLRAEAHHLHPVVSVGQHGLTPQVLHEIEVALDAHALVKVRVFNDDRDEREALLRDICVQARCAPVQHLGKTLILWRAPREEKAAAKKGSNATGANAAKAGPRSGAGQSGNRKLASPQSASARKTGGRKSGAAKTGTRKAALPGATVGRRAAGSHGASPAGATPSRKPGAARRARGQPLTAMDEPERPARSPKAPRATPSSKKSPRGKGRSPALDARGASPMQATRTSPAVAPRVAGRRTAGGPAGVPRAPNPRRRRGQSR